MSEPETSQQPVISADDGILDLLRCPVTGERLRVEDDALVSETTGVRYPMRDGVPLLLPGEAKTATDA